MIRDKVIFIIPGFRQLPTSRAYKNLAKILKKEGYHPVLVSIPWKNSTISENSDYFISKYKKVKARKKYVLGFSYGAMIAFLASTKIKSNGLILCSLSPYFQEDISTAKNRVLSRLATQRYMDFSKLHCSLLAKRLKTKQVVMLYGTLEARALIKRVRTAFSEIDSENKQLLKVKKAEHNISDKKYTATIQKATKFLT